MSTRGSERERELPEVTQQVRSRAGTGLVRGENDYLLHQKPLDSASDATADQSLLHREAFEDECLGFVDDQKPLQCTEKGWLNLGAWGSAGET